MWLNNTYYYTLACYTSDDKYTYIIALSLTEILFQNDLKVPSYAKFKTPKSPQK